MLTLYHLWQCPYCVRTRIVLDEKEIEYEGVDVDLKNKPAALMKRNPKGKVPVLQDGDLVIYESHIINEYLDERYRRHPLMPADPGGRARVRLLHDLCDSELAPRLYSLAKQTVFRDQASLTDEPALAAAIDGVAGALGRVRDELGDRPFVLGDFGLADITFAPWIVGLEKMGMPKDRVPGEVADWGERLLGRPSVARQMAERL